MNNENSELKINCSESELLIDEFLDGMISVSDKERMDSHIADCPKCKDYYAKTEMLVRSLGSMQGDAAKMTVQKKDEMWNKIASEIDIERHKKQRTAAEKKLLDAKKKKPDFIYRYRYALGSVAAAILIVFIIFGVKNIGVQDTRLSQQSSFGLETYWKVSNIKGTPLIGNAAMGSSDSIREGQWISTNDSSRAEMIVAGIGSVIIEPNSKVIFVKANDGNNRIFVEYGTIAANINSKPKTFFVEMPSAVASDMGGAYTLTIDSSGDGIVYVKEGKVEVQSKDREAIVPAGNLVMTKRNIGVGTPFNEYTSPQFRNALFKFDFGKCEDRCVNTMLDNAKITDAVTLVNLIPKVGNEVKDEVYARLANFVPPPRPVAKDSIPFINEDEINQWVDKIQKEIDENVKKNLENVEKSLSNLKNMEIHFDSIPVPPVTGKNYNFKFREFPKQNYKWNSDTAYFDKEKFEEDMNNLQENIEEHSFDKEQFKEDMKQLQEDLNDMKLELKESQDYNNEELKKEMERAKEEIRDAMKELNKELRIKINSGTDTTLTRFEYKYKKDSTDVDLEAPEPPEPDEEK